MGYTVTFVTGTAQQQDVESIEGVEFVRFKGTADYDTDDLSKAFPDRPKEGVTAVWDVEHIFSAPLQDQFATIQDVLLKSSQAAKKKVVVIHDGVFMGMMPSLLGSPQAIRVATIGIGHFPLMIMSEDTAPFGTGIEELAEKFYGDVGTKGKNDGEMQGQTTAGALVA